ncbi:hypothetical protein MG293_012847 [Ovis ammon polii]|uniref:Uncharacterized protein n=1 Tax=Ovis ammon polii TaxID=230172 RepID=A0AAD4U2H4_OVIAM|nr:hypothetical protein MG293_012847 [Ovis ammon polii]
MAADGGGELEPLSGSEKCSPPFVDEAPPPPPPPAGLLALPLADRFFPSNSGPFSIMPGMVEEGRGKGEGGRAEDPAELHGKGVTSEKITNGNSGRIRAVAYGSAFSFLNHFFTVANGNQIIQRLECSDAQYLLKKQMDKATELKPGQLNCKEPFNIQWCESISIIGLIWFLGPAETQLQFPHHEWGLCPQNRHTNTKSGHPKERFFGGYTPLMLPMYSHNCNGFLPIFDFF